MRGIILHGGAGTRLRPLTFSGPKQLIPVANKPVSQYALENLIDCGIEDIAIVLGDVYSELVREHYGDGSKFGVKVTYILQGKPLGIAHAINLCKDFIDNEPFIVFLGDNLLQHGVKKYLQKFIRGNYDVYILLKEVEDPTRFGVAKFDENGKILGVVEKPKVPPSKHALVGVYFFKPTVFDVIKSLKPSWRGELEITDAIQSMLEHEYKIGHSTVEGWWLDTGKKDDILYANSMVLDEQIERKIEGETVNSQIYGRTAIGQYIKVSDSIIRGPIVIGKSCLIKSSFIGPYTSIGNNSKIVNSNIEYSVVMENITIEYVERIEESLIGKNSIIRKNYKQRALKFNIGEYSEIEV